MKIFKTGDFRHRFNGFTLIELIVTVVILSVLAAAALPMLQTSVKRQKEARLRESLHDIREALDAYKLAYDKGLIVNKVGLSGYPPNLQVLVDGIQDSKDPNKKLIRFLRKIPQDPFYSPDYEDDPQWGLRSYESEAKDPREGADVYDVYSLSPMIGTNNQPYSQW